MIAQAESTVYQIHLPQFEGPFDLLLFFIERDELDIHDIPISKITTDFLEYIHNLESLNMEVASEFILVAATLMKIKAKMLLPRPVILEDGTVEDPRTELVNRLLEYKRYKAVLADIEQMEEENIERIKRGYTKKEEKLLLESEYPEDELVGIDLYTLMKTFHRLWEKRQDVLARPKHVIRKYPYSTDQLKGTLMQKLQTNERVDFLSYVLEQPDVVYAVFGFLAVLDLVQYQKVRVILGEGYNNFWMVKNENPDPHFTPPPPENEDEDQEQAA